MSIKENILRFKNEVPDDIKIIAVSKTKTEDDIMKAYDVGQKIFGENKVQELVRKYENLPKDIEWHMIGHLQTNKVKFIAPFVHLIHAVDSLKLLKIINKEAKKNKRIINCLLQIYIAKEDTKFGLSIHEARDILEVDGFLDMKNVRINGVMGMASYNDDEEIIRSEFTYLAQCFLELKQNYFDNSQDFKDLSMGMSGDYKIAIDEGGTIIRIGSLIFGERNYVN